MKKRGKGDPAQSSRRGRSPRPGGEEKLERLQEALIEVIGQVGVGGITHRRLAEQAGVSLSATTYYFESKNDMARKAYKFFCDGVIADAERLKSEFDDPTTGSGTRESDAAAIGAYMQSLLRASPNESLARIELMLTVARDAEARRSLASDRKAIHEIMVGLMEESGSPLPEADADLVSALISGLLLEYHARGAPTDFGDRASEIVQRVARWLVADD